MDILVASISLENSESKSSEIVSTMIKENEKKRIAGMKLEETIARPNFSSRFTTAAVYNFKSRFDFLYTIDGRVVSDGQ